MKERDKLSKLRDALLAQDPPSPTRASAHQEILLTKIRQRMHVEKMLVGAVYAAVFLLALFSFLEAGHAQEAARAVWWAVCSMHLVLWFLVFFLWRVERLVDRILPLRSRVRRTRGETRAVFIAALAVCALGTGFLVQAAYVQNPLRLAQAAGYVLWCPVFFLVWYPLGIATAAARLCVKFREMELQAPTAETGASSSPPGDASASEAKSKRPSL